MFNISFLKKNHNNKESVKTNNAEPAKEEPTEELMKINIIEAEDVNPVSGRHKKHRNSIQSEEFRLTVWNLIRMKYKNREIAQYLSCAVGFFYVSSTDVAIAKQFLKNNSADFTPFKRLNKQQKELKSKVDQVLGFNLETVSVEVVTNNIQNQKPSIVGFLAMYTDGTTIFMDAEKIKSLV